MAVRKTCKWCIIIMLLLLATGGGYGYYFWKDSNRILLQKVRESIAKIAPKWKIEIESARYDWHRRIHLFSVTLRDPTDQKNIATVPEIVLTIDREKFTDDQTVVIQHVLVKNPSVRLSRDAKNQWNWKFLPKLPKRETPYGSPDWSIENGSVNVELAFAGFDQQQVLSLKTGNLKVVPKGRGQYALKGEIVPEGLGIVGFEGEWNPDSGGWIVRGNIHRQTSIENIVDFTAKISPKLRSLLDVLSPKDNLTAENNSGKIQQSLARGAQGSVNIDFRFAQWKKNAELEYHILTKIERAQMAHPALPFPLYDIEGQIIWSHQQVVLQNLSASNRDSKISLKGEIDKKGNGRIDLDLRNLKVNSQLRQHLPQSWWNAFDSVRPEGLLNVTGTFSLENNTKWKPHNFVIKARDVNILPEKFAYPVKNLEGTVTQNGKQWDLNFRGTASSQPVQIKGWMINLGPKVDVYIDARCANLELNQTLLKACDPDVRRTLEKMGLKGSTQVRLQLHRLAGLNQPFLMLINGSFQNASLIHRSFPYRISGLSGSVEYDSLAQRWSFDNLKGHHGRAILSGNGSLTKRNGKSAFEVTITADDAPIDRDLYLALQSDLQSQWKAVSPRGTMNLVTKITWADGQEVSVSLPSIKIQQGSFRLSAFPYEFKRVTASLVWDSPTLEILDLDGFHGQTHLTASGFVKTDPSGEWLAHFRNIKTKDLVADRSLYEALPEDLRLAAETLNPQGPFTLSGSLQLRGTDRPNDPVTAAWDILCEFPDNTIEVGVQLEHVKGMVTSYGQWDGVKMRMDERNHIALEHAKLWGYQLRDIQGPYRFVNQQLLVGSRGPFLSQQKKTAGNPAIKRDSLTAKVIGGVITLDSFVDFRTNVKYQARVQMKNGDLGLYARTYYPQTKNVKGVINGWFDFWGTGTSENAIKGQGEVGIRPAALYELPVFLQMLSVVNFTTTPDKTAFNSAYAEFSLQNRIFEFKKIELQGESISMSGVGLVDFDQRLALNFYSVMPREILPRDILSQIVRNATTGLVGFEVRGKTSSPTVKVQPLARLDNGIQNFLKSLPTSQFLNPVLAPIGLLPRQLFPQVRPVNKRRTNNKFRKKTPNFRRR